MDEGSANSRKGGVSVIKVIVLCVLMMFFGATGCEEEPSPVEREPVAVGDAVPRTADWPCQPKRIQTPSPDQDMVLEIPELGLEREVLYDADVMDAHYLDQGLVHYQMSNMPSPEEGNVAIAGHRKPGMFINLHHLEEGDRIALRHLHSYYYKVTDVFTVEPNDWSIIEPADTPQITLTTCEHDWMGEPYKRLIVTAELFDVSKVKK